MTNRKVWLAAVLALSACDRGGAPVPTGAERGDPLLDSKAARGTIADLQQRYRLQPVAQVADEKRAAQRKRAVATPLVGRSIADRFESTKNGIAPRFSDEAMRGTPRQGAVLLPATADGVMRLADVKSGVSLTATLVGATAAKAEAGEGMLLYRGGYSGFDLVERPTPEGTEEFVHFNQAPANAEVHYTVALGAKVAGLRLAAGTLEVLDAEGAPRLRVSPPFLVDAAGARHEASLAVKGCAVDTSLVAPWGRATVRPGADLCELAITWDSANVAYPALLDPAWNATGSLNGPRDYHQQIMLGNGKVLAVAGENAVNSVIATCELFDPLSGTWAVTGGLATARRSFAMSLLQSGKVLVAGGLGGPIVATTEIYDPALGTWAPSGNLGTPRFNPAAFTLTAGPNAGKVLIIGGRIAGQVGIASCELWNPGTDTWAPAAPINTARGFDFASAVQLNDGSPFIVGGASPVQNWLASAEKYNQVAGTWSFTASLATGREDFSLNVLGDGKVLAAGGSVNGGTTDTTELYDPAGNTWTPSGSFPDGQRLGQTGTTLAGNKVLVTGGANPGWTESTLLWTEAAGTWAPQGDMLFTTNTLYGQTALDGTHVLVSGGINGNNFAPSKSTAQIFTVQTNGGPCAGNGDCPSGFCVSGICCNSACTPLPNTTLSCSLGTCAVTSCSAAFGDCNGAAGDGCETALTAIPNCGACGATCDDANACTHDICNAGACGHVDVKACAGGCGPAIGCGYTDTDSDGLNDVWESNGYIDLDCNGANDVGTDTPLPGADVNKPNVYVKFDYMTTGGHSHQPTVAAMNQVKAAYLAHNTILNFFPSSDALAEHTVVSLLAPAAMAGAVACTGADAISLYTIKAAHFPSYLAPAYHYAVFAHYNTCDSDGDCSLCAATGKSAASPPFGLSGLAELPGNDFIVSLGQLVDLGVNPIPDLSNAGTFMHELGHNLGLRHGGNDDFNNKPNYISIMNYSYQFGIGFTAAPGPYPTDTNDPSVGYRVDYSGFPGGTLHEGMAGGGICVADGSGGMSEPAGVTGGGAGSTDVVVFYSNGAGQNAYAPSNGTAVDWDGNPPANNLHAYADVTGEGACNTLTGFEDWAQTNVAGVTTLANLATGFQCNTGNWADGAPLPGTVEDREPTGTKIFGDHKALPFLPVTVDVRPGCGSNWIAVGGPGTVNVAALGAANFDVHHVVAASLRFGGAAAVSSSIADVNGDGRADIIGVFQMSALHLTPPSTTGSLTGALDSSQAFGGKDNVTFVPYPGPVVTQHNDGTGYARTMAAPDHHIVPYTLADCVDAAVSRCGAALNVNQAGHIVRITSDENDDGRGGGPKHDDGDDDDDGCEPKGHHDHHDRIDDMAITGNASFKLERERLGHGNGRVYTIVYDVSDADGNSSRWQCKIQVPHDKKSVAVDGPVHECIGNGC